MHDLPLLINITLALVVAFCGGLIARRIGLPTIVGYLFAGIVIGPFTPGFVGDPRDQRTVERLEDYNSEHGIWDCTRCYFCNERCPKGVDPRDAIAKLGAESIRVGIDRDMGAKHAKWFIRSTETTGWLRETELVPKTQGVFTSLKEIGFALNLARRGKVPLPFPPHCSQRCRFRY